MLTEPITPNFGVVVRDVDLSAPLAAELVNEVRSLLLGTRVVIFPDQNLDHAQHEVVAHAFGTPRYDPLEQVVDGYPGLSELDNVPVWHADWMHQPTPPSFSILQMTRVPPIGGDTLFADLVSSYESLSPSLRGFLERLTVEQGLSESNAGGLERSYLERHGADTAEYEDVRRRLRSSRQPLVRYIPETEQVNYWICQLYTRRICELGADESDALLRMLFQHQLAPEYVIRWKWHPGDVIMWDQRTTLHRGVRDYGDVRRHGSRASIDAAPVLPVPGMNS